MPVLRPKRLSRRIHSATVSLGLGGLPARGAGSGCGDQRTDELHRHHAWAEPALRICPSNGGER